MLLCMWNAHVHSTLKPCHTAYFLVRFSVLQAAGRPLTLCMICFWLQMFTATASARWLKQGGRSEWESWMGNENFAPLQERRFTQASLGLICQHDCSEVTAANCWKREHKCNYQWEWDLKLVCYFKWADGPSWHNLKILQFHNNVSYKKQNSLNAMMIMGPFQPRYHSFGDTNEGCSPGNCS